MTRRMIAGKIRLAIMAIPDRNEWRTCALIYVLFLLCAMPIGLLSGLLHPALAPLSVEAAAVSAITLLAHPAFTEELIFRVLLLPHRAEARPQGSLYARVAIALAVFVAAHPLNARLVWPASLPLFANAYYLALAALLGLACSAAYLVSGSIWPSVLIHWTTVAAWIFLLGGRSLLDSYR